MPLLVTFDWGTCASHYGYTLREQGTGYGNVFLSEGTWIVDYSWEGSSAFRLTVGGGELVIQSGDSSGVGSWSMYIDSHSDLRWQVIVSGNANRTVAFRKE